MAILFDFSGQSVGGRKLEALRRAAESEAISLRARGARFVDGATFADITFSDIDAEDAELAKDLIFTRCAFEGRVSFDNATLPTFVLTDCRFASSVFLRSLSAKSVTLRDTACLGYVSFDNSCVAQIRMNEVTFSADARFRGMLEPSDARFTRVTFERSASFQGSRCTMLRLAQSRFEGAVHFENARLQTLDLERSTFAAARWLRLAATVHVNLDEATFERPVNLAVAAPLVTAVAAVFEQGMDCQVAPGATIDFGGVSLNGSSVLVTQRDDAAVSDSRAKLVSLSGARIESLVLRELDLSECTFAKAHSLDDVIVDGRGQLALAPANLIWTRRREVLFDEQQHRHRAELRRRPNGPARWWSAAAALGVTDMPVSRLAETYRSLRRGRESARDASGASDFYYGEMEMRRRSAPSWSERVLLAAYWAISGYGMRASRSLLAYGVVTLLLATVLSRWGVTGGAPAFADVLAYVIATTTVIARPPSELTLSTIGAFVQIAARIVGPTLFGLTLLALRSRVRR